MRTVKLGEVVDFYSGATPAKANTAWWQGDVSWFSAKDLKTRMLRDSIDHVSSEVFASTPLRLLPAGTVVMVVRGMILAHTVPICEMAVEGAINQDIKALIPRNTQIHQPYLAHILRAHHQQLLDRVSTAAHGTKKLDARVLAGLEIPLPSLEEQRRIAAILDQADAIRTKRRQVLAHLDALPQSLFRDMFGEPGSWATRWQTGTIGDLAESAQYGTSSPAGGAGEWPVLRMGNLTDDARLDLQDLKFMDLAPNDVPKYTLQRGDLLFNRTNSKEKVGKACVIHTDQKLAYAGYLVRVRFAESATGDFVATYLTSTHGQAVRRRLAKAAVNQANINAKEMQAIRIAHPPLALRQEFAEHLKFVRAQREQIQRVAAEDDELFASLQARAFRGEL